MNTPFSGACPASAPASATSKGNRSATWQLTRGLAQGEEKAFREFHQAYFDRLFRYLMAVTQGDEQAARDALQETFIRVARHARAMDCESTFWSWLTVLARSAVIDAGRRQSRYRRLLERFARFLSVRAEVAPEPEASVWHEALRREVANLPALERGLIEAKYGRGASVRQLAREFDLSEKAVESRLHRARRQLRDLLRPPKNHEA